MQISKASQGKRPSFLKKRSKKLLILNADASTSAAERRKSFLVLFFKKEQAFSYKTLIKNDFFPDRLLGFRRGSKPLSRTRMSW